MTSTVYHNSHKVNKSSKSRSASGWSAWAHTTAAIRKSMARQSEPVHGVRCCLCNRYVDHLVKTQRADGMIVPACEECNGKVA